MVFQYCAEPQDAGGGVGEAGGVQRVDEPRRGRQQGVIGPGDPPGAALQPAGPHRPPRRRRVRRRRLPGRERRESPHRERVGRIDRRLTSQREHPADAGEAVIEPQFPDPAVRQDVVNRRLPRRERVVRRPVPRGGEGVAPLLQPRPVRIHRGGAGADAAGLVRQVQELPQPAAGAGGVDQKVGGDTHFAGARPFPVQLVPAAGPPRRHRVHRRPVEIIRPRVGRAGGEEVRPGPPGDNARPPLRPFRWPGRTIHSRGPLPGSNAAPGSCRKYENPRFRPTRTGPPEAVPCRVSGGSQSRPNR